MENNYDIFKDPTYRFHPALVLEHYMPMRVRRVIAIVTGIIVAIFVVYMMFPYILRMLPVERLPAGVVAEYVQSALTRLDQIETPDSVTVPSVVPYIGGSVMLLDPNSPRVNGLFFILFAVWLAMKMLGWFRNSYYYHVEALLERGKTGAKTPYTTPNYETNELYFHTRGGDLTESFVLSRVGAAILLRSGLPIQDAKTFLAARTALPDFRLVPEIGTVFTLRDVVKMLVTMDQTFADFLFSRGIRPEDVFGAADWAEREYKKRRRKERFWGRANLGQGRGIGADLSYGIAYALERYCQDLSQAAVGGGISFNHIYGSAQIAQLEIILARGKEANAVLVGEEGTGKMDVILDLARDIANGFTNEQLSNKRILAFDGVAFASRMRSKSEFETELIKALNSAVYAGNIILVIDDFPGFVLSGMALEVDVIAVLDPYLSSARIQFIATSDVARYHSLLEPNGTFSRRFERVQLLEPELDTIVGILEESALCIEPRYHLFFTYQSIVSIIESAERYFPDGVMPDKAIDLMIEIAPAVAAQGKSLITKEEVLNYVQAKTNIPVGNISDDERKRLEQLEALLQMHVIGQQNALLAVANAMRRSRAGVRNPNRPIGTFLFLGPTGVGKTETAKALATVFFGDENAMSRLDMSEYQGEDGLVRLIGSNDGRVGTLPTMLKEHPYGVLLLDEFEKTNTKVLDLFLQVLDEGMFHDASGKKVNARNVIFIATSNAGATVLRDAVRQGIDVESVRQQVIDAVVSEGKFKPELLNRFDGVVLFHTLSTDEYKQIAMLMLQKLKKRLREKSIDLVINDALLAAVLAHGVDPEFGARPMNRAVQEVVEQKVAEKIIKGQVKPGAKLEFTAEDFAS